MNKITFPRSGYNKEPEAKTIRKKYIDGTIAIGNGKGKATTQIKMFDFTRIKTELDIIIVAATDATERRIATMIKKFACKQLILGKPDELKRYIDKFTRKELAYIKNNKKFKNAILGVFRYEAIRNSMLLGIAKMLNVKCCPYCNMSYTLYIKGTKGNPARNRFQFDHFFSQKEYPFLSASLYNLIPACGGCNHAKSAGGTSLEINPYHADIHKLFVFRINDASNGADFATLKLLLGMEVEPDSIEVKLECEQKNKRAVNELDSFARLTDQYGRHKDVVQEVYAKRYMQAYYTDAANFGFLDGAPTSIDPMRLLLGTYTDSKDIEKRTMTKFIQDIWAQANETI